MKSKEIIKKIVSLTKNYNFIYFTTDMRGFLYNKSIDSYEDFFLKLFNELNKNDITSIIPSYTYTTSGKFDVYKTKPKLGLLTKWSFAQTKILRSSHPLFSCIGIGKNKNILKKVKKSAFGISSIFDNLYKNKSCMIHLGRPLELGNTSIHYVEQMVGATYRYNKEFETKVYNRNKYLGTNYTAFVRYLNTKKKDNYITNTLKFARVLKKHGLVKENGNLKDNNNITFLDYNNSIDLMVDEFYKDKYIFINRY